MKKKTTPEAESLIYDMKEQGHTHNEVKEKLKKDLGITLSDERITHYWKKKKLNLGQEIKKQSSKISELNDLVEEEKLYEIEGEDVVFYKSQTDSMGDKFKKRFAIPVDELGEIVYDYSYLGGNLSGQKILNKYELNRELWNLIKSRLYITKDSNACPEIVLDYIKENKGDDAVEEKIIEVSSRHINDKYKKQRKETYPALFKKEAEKAIRTLNNLDEYIKYLQPLIDSYEPREVEKLPEVVNESKVLFVAFGDLHFGRTTEEIIKRLNKLEKKIIARPEGTIVLKCMGDIVESIVEGGMHPGQTEEMDQYGFGQVIEASKVIEDFLSNIRKSGKAVRMDGVTGNHDRIGKNHNEDKYRTAGLVFYEFVKRGLQNTDIIINYVNNKVLKMVDEKMNFIMHHGDDGFIKKKSEVVLNNYGEYGIHNVILQGHIHNGEMTEGKNYTRVTVPSINIGNRYSEEELMLSSEPGAVFIKANEENKPDVTFTRL